MPVRLTDSQIEVLVLEKKHLPSDFGNKLALKPKRGHNEGEMSVTGENGGHFVVIIRQSKINILDFSVILCYEIPGSNQRFRLRRYNGNSHEHTNRLEQETIQGFHVHCATERYQTSGGREDAFARATSQYSDCLLARDCMFQDCGFVVPPGGTGNLFAQDEQP